MNRTFVYILATMMAVSVLSCQKDVEAETAADVDTGKLQPRKLIKDGVDVKEIDINKDGHVDQRIYSKKGNVLYIQRDFNFDEVLDLTEFYENGMHVRDEIDLDYDGIVDLIVTYKNDIAVKKEYSVDFEGNRHGIQYFDATGVRTEIHRDTNHDGMIDIIEYYNKDGAKPYKTEKVQQNKVSN